MNIEAKVTITGTKQSVWAVITDIENAANVIGGIEKVEVLEKPDVGLVGLKWRETRKVFGKTADEVMWITDAVEGESYEARAESNGCIYVSTMSVVEQGGSCELTMIHDTQTQGSVAKVIGAVLGLVFKGLMRKMFLKDLNDIKAAVEA